MRCWQSEGLRVNPNDPQKLLTNQIKFKIGNMVIIDQIQKYPKTQAWYLFFTKNVLTNEAKKQFYICFN
jgi:hypothetical protein